MNLRLSLLVLLVLVHAVKSFARDGLDLHHAAAKGDLKKVEALLGMSDVNRLDSEGYPAFYYALDNGYEDLALVLLKKTDLSLKVGAGKDSVLVMSIQKSCVACARFVLGQKKELVNLKNEDGFTPAMVAARLSHLEMMKILVDAGADLAAKNKFGKTALDIAIRSQNSDVEKYLKSFKK